MGERAVVLFVSPIVGFRRLALLALVFCLTLRAPAAAGTVRAQDYDAFWLWAAVRPQPALATAQTIYILQGQVAAPEAKDGEGRLIAQGGAIPHLRGARIWLDYRAHTL